MAAQPPACQLGPACSPTLLWHLGAPALPSLTSLPACRVCRLHADPGLCHRPGGAAHLMQRGKPPLPHKLTKFARVEGTAITYPAGQQEGAGGAQEVAGAAARTGEAAKAGGQKRISSFFKQQSKGDKERQQQEQQQARAEEQRRQRQQRAQKRTAAAERTEVGQASPHASFQTKQAAPKRRQAAQRS